MNTLTDPGWSAQAADPAWSSNATDEAFGTGASGSISEYLGAGALQLTGLGLTNCMLVKQSTGDLSLVGLSTSAKSWLRGGAGDMSLIGSSVAHHTANYLVDAGSLLLSSESLYAHARTREYLGIGQLSLSGAIDCSVSKDVRSSGNLTLLGSANLARTFAVVGLGALALDGASAVGRARSVTGQGVLFLSGGGTPALCHSAHVVLESRMALLQLQPWTIRIRSVAHLGPLALVVSLKKPLHSGATLAEWVWLSSSLTAFPQDSGLSGFGLSLSSPITGRDFTFISPLVN